jgi:hypothetical protein
MIARLSIEGQNYMTIPKVPEFEYDVAISFAGENRDLARQLFEILNSKDIRVFYDANEQATLWGKDLYEFLSEVYFKRARYCLMIVSEYYRIKTWTQLERRSAQARAFQQTEEYILPIRLDDTELPGLLETVGYIDARRKNPEEIANLVIQKLTISAPAKANSNSKNPKSPTFNIPIPEIRKKFTQRDKDRFLEQSWDSIQSYFQQGVEQLEKQSTQIQTDFKIINAMKFVARIYIDGELKNQCKIWLGSDFGPSIHYLEGIHIDLQQDNSYNDYLMVDEQENRLVIRLSSMWLGGKRPAGDMVTPEQAAEYLWSRFTNNLNP